MNLELKAAITPREITLEPSLSASIMKQEGEGGGVGGALVGAWVGVVCTVLQSRQALLLVSQSDWLIFPFSIRVQSTRLELSSMFHARSSCSPVSRILGSSE